MIGSLVLVYKYSLNIVIVEKKVWWFFPVKRNVSLEMVKEGLACVYDGSLASFDG